VTVLKKLLRDRNFIFFLALVLGLLVEDGARYGTHVIIPVIGLIMTLSVMGIMPLDVRSAPKMLRSAGVGIVVNYGLLGGVLLLLSSLFISNRELLSGFIIVAAVPPAVAIIPFTMLLQGNRSLSLFGVIGGYLGALIIMPLMTALFLGTNIADPGEIILIVVELIVLPVIVSSLLVRTRLAARIEPVRGTLVNWSFFVVFYIIIGVNKEIIITNTLSLIPVLLIGFASTFFLGFVITGVGRLFHHEPSTMTSVMLLGTLKNYGLAAGLAFTIFDERAALPAAMLTVCMILYLIWLGVVRTVTERWKTKKR
jgi:BASS family bile acid:Na+ symporter